MSYSVQVTVTSKGGATVYNLQVAQGDDTPHNVTAAYGLADPLTITQRLTDDPRLPLSHPEPDEATLALIAPDNTTYQDMDLGDPIAVKLYPIAGFAGTPVTFYGRIASLQGDPHPLGVKLTLSCVDYTADLAELPVGAVAYPLERADGPGYLSTIGRVPRIAAEAGIPTPSFIGVGAITALGAPLVAARAINATDAYSLLRDTLDSIAQSLFSQDENGNAYTGTRAPQFRPYLVQNITNGLLDPALPFSIRIGKPYTRRIAYAPPYRLVNVAGTYTVQVSAANNSPTTGAPILDGGRVTFAPSFVKVKGGGLPVLSTATDAQGGRAVWDWRNVSNDITVGGGTYGPGGWQPYGFTSPAVASTPANIQEITSVIDSTNSPIPGDAASALLGLYRVPFRPDTISAWAVGTMSWQAWAEPETIYAWTGTAGGSPSVKRTNNPETTDTNLHPDPNGTQPTGLLGFVLNSGTLTYDAANAWRGISNTVKVTTTVNNWGYLPLDGRAVGPLTVPLAVAGHVYTVQILVKSDTAQTVVLQQYGTPVATGAPVTLAPGTWADLNVTFTAGTVGGGNGPFVAVRHADGTPLLGQVWISTIMVREAPTTTPYWVPGDPISPSTQWIRPDLTQLLTVARAQTGKLPNVREWVSGLVIGSTTRVEKGRTTVDMDLAPPSYDFVANREDLGASLGVVSMDSPIISGVTLSQLSARDSFNDYAMVRGT